MKMLLQRQADLCEFKVSLVYRVSFNTAGAMQTGKSCLEKKKKNPKTNKQTNKSNKAVVWSYKKKSIELSRSSTHIRTPGKH
jgi:hypothetical protein